MFTKHIDSYVHKSVRVHFYVEVGSVVQMFLRVGIVMYKRNTLVPMYIKVCMYSFM